MARLALGAAVLFAIVRVRREVIPRSGPLWVHIAVAALFANAVPYLLFAVAEQTVDSSTAGIINATTPLWTVMLALAVRHQKSVTSWQAAGLIVGFAGAVLIFTPWHTAGGLFSAGGLECLAASVSYAVSYIYMDRFLARRGIGPGRAVRLPARRRRRHARDHPGRYRRPDAACHRRERRGDRGAGDHRDRVRVRAELPDHHQRGSDGRSTVTYLLPVVAIVLGVLVLGESITATTLAGIALVLAGVALTRRQVKPASGEHQVE